MIGIIVLMRSRQPYLSDAFKVHTEHGGSIRKGQRKLRRPLDPKRPIHLVLRSSKARGALSLWHHKHAWKVELLTRKCARRFGVRIYEYANAGNHLHLVVRGSTREGLQNFFRKFAGATAQLVTGAKKGRAFGKFWDSVIYTRVLEWGRSLRSARNYVTLNAIESGGVFIPGLRKKKGQAPPLKRC